MMISEKTRALAAITSVIVTVLTLFAFGVGAVLCLLLLLGAVLSRRRPRVGQTLLILGAGYTSLLTIPYGLLGLLEEKWSRDPLIIIGIVSVLSLVVACDLALVCSALRDGGKKMQT